MTEGELKQKLIDLAGKCADQAAEFESAGNAAHQAERARAWLRITGAAVNALATLESKTPAGDALSPRG